MKNPTLKALLLMGAAMAMGACSDVAEDNRFVEVDAVKPERNVLIEDYTGQFCVNCPAAHEVLDALTGQYPDHVIPVSIHAGSFGYAVEYTQYPDYVGLMQPEGDRMASRRGVSSYPAGVIDGRSPVNADSWAKAVADRLAVPSDVEIDVNPVLDGSDISINIIMRPSADIQANLHVWVVEDGIRAMQSDRSGEIVYDYVHNNVFRCSVNGEEGQSVTLKDNVYSSATFSVKVKDTDTEKWNPSNLAVVAFLEDASGVLQAARAAVRPLPVSE